MEGTAVVAHIRMLLAIGVLHCIGCKLPRGNHGLQESAFGLGCVCSDCEHGRSIPARGEAGPAAAWGRGQLTTNWSSSAWSGLELAHPIAVVLLVETDREE